MTKITASVSEKVGIALLSKAGYVFGALQPPTDEVSTVPSTRRTLVNWIDFHLQFEEGIPKDVERVYAV